MLNIGEACVQRLAVRFREEEFDSVDLGFSPSLTQHVPIRWKNRSTGLAPKPCLIVSHHTHNLILRYPYQAALWLPFQYRSLPSLFTKAPFSGYYPHKNGDTGDSVYNKFQHLVCS